MPVTSLPALHLAKDLGKAIRLGHPWVYDGALEPGQRHLVPGALVRIVYHGRDLAVAFADPDGPIAARILARGHLASRAGSARWVASQAARAGRCRADNPALRATDAIRLIHGENDDLPGLIVDLYSDTAVVACDGPAATAFWRPRIAWIFDGLAETGFSPVRVWAKSPGEVIAGDPPPDELIISEHSARFEVDVRRGQKTGFFLDQRDNRRRVRDLAGSAEVLNLFAYSGGFSVHAALGGARRVTSVDSARPALAAAQRNFARNGLDPSRHRFVRADCFDFLAGAAKRGARYDIVISDPPSFAPSKRARRRALDAYRRLNRMAMQVTARDGWLVSASCSSHITLGDLIDVLGWAGERSGRWVQIVDIRGAAGDHPVRVGFPEGHYLKLVVARIS